MQRVADIFEHDIFMKDGRLVGLSRTRRRSYLRFAQQRGTHRAFFRPDYRSGRSLAVTARAVSDAAVERSELRHAQGYSISMLVAESRILHVCIFKYNSLSPDDFRLVLWDANTIADECDKQLKQTLASFTRRAR
jgi:hypothetical protein